VPRGERSWSGIESEIDRSVAQDDLTPEELVKAIEDSLKDFKDGDLVEGTVVKVDRDEVLVDIGFKSEGIIPVKELSIRQDVEPAEVVKVGDHIEALVLQTEDKEGRLILSKKRAQYERSWIRIEQIMKEGGTIEGPVIEVVKGGLILDIGLRGFLPASLVELRRVRDLHPYVGQRLECKIIELDRNRNNVVLSRRAFLEESQSEGRKKFLESLKKGERRRGQVSSIVNFGAFVDIGGGVDGLVHVSELSWKHVDHPSEVVSVGQEVEVEILDVDLDRERVSLSLKATQEDPWREFERRYQTGEIISGQVTKLVPFGAFVRVGEGIEGLVHISELSTDHVDSPEQVVQVGQDVRVKVVDVDVPRRRISLSIKRVGDEPEVLPEVEIEAEATQEVSEAVVSEPAPETAASLADAEARGDESTAEAFEATIEPEPLAPEAAAVHEIPEPALEPEPVVEAGPEPEPESAPPPQPESEPEPQPAEASEEDEGDVTLESILEDLKRREGRT
jgi:small subunit ribosomal protein S1